MLGASGMSEVDSAHFRQVLGRFPTGVTVITAAGCEGRPTGFAVGSFFSVSLEPPLVGFCAGKGSSSWPAIRSTGAFCVNVLSHDQEQLCRQFSSKTVDKFEGLDWQAASTGSPRLAGVVAWIDCDIESVHDAGDHEICIGRVRALDIDREEGPLLFYRSGYGRFVV